MPDSPVHELSREVVNALIRAADSGAAVTISGLQEELGLGHRDAQAILDQLREAGMASEVAPGEWSGVLREAEDEPERLPAQPPDDRPLEESPLREIPLRDRPIEWPPPMDLTPPQETVKLTRAMVEALDDEALGKLVRAGVAGTDHVRLFVLLVA